MDAGGEVGGGGVLTHTAHRLGVLSTISQEFKSTHHSDVFHALESGIVLTDFLYGFPMIIGQDLFRSL